MAKKLTIGDVQSKLDHISYYIRCIYHEVENLQEQIASLQKEEFIKRHFPEPTMEELLKVIKEKGGSGRIESLFKQYGIDSIEKLLGYSRTDLMSLKDFGKKSICAISDALYEWGIDW